MQKNTTHYQVDRAGFHINGADEKYNRVLYGSHSNDDLQERYFTFAGDLPVFLGASTDYEKNLFCFYAKNGMLQSGLALTPGVQIPYFYSDRADLSSCWFHRSDDVAATFHDGYISYELSQFSPWFPSTKVEIEAYPLLPDDGFLIRYKIHADQRVHFCAGFGGITDFLGRFEYNMIAEREFRNCDAKGNRVYCGKNRAVIESDYGTTMHIGSSFDAEFTQGTASEMTASVPGVFLKNSPPQEEGEGEIVKITAPVSANEEFTGFLVVLRNPSSADRLDFWLHHPDPCKYLRAQIRDKRGDFALHSPNAVLDETVNNTLLALDASFHRNAFYHGAHGYHTPFLGWRNYYAPTNLGWFDRVRTAIRAHFATQYRQADGPEKVWYDGADRPELDHEGTQYHHLQNTTGRVPALLHRDDIYNMQEVSTSMTLHYLLHSGDLALAEEIFESLDLALDHEERIYDYDSDGLYQNFLNTWISDGHSYNGGGCAQSSAYNYQANRIMAELAVKLGKPAEKYTRRADKIYRAVQEKLWLNHAGILAEYIDTVGNKLVHPSPELSTIYLAIECGLTDAFQSYRMLRFTHDKIQNIVTNPSAGRLVYSANWRPKKYSTCGVFPAENACLALAYLQLGQKEEGLAILNGLLDAFCNSKNPGMVRHVISDRGGTDLGDFDFTDFSSTYLRMLIEGVWGVRFNLFHHSLEISPAIPDDWDNGSLRTPEISISVQKQGRLEVWRIDCVPEAAKIIRLPMMSATVESVRLNGRETAWSIESGIGTAWICVETDESHFSLEVIHGETAKPQLSIPFPATVFSGNSVRLAVDGGEILEYQESSGVTQVLCQTATEMDVNIVGQEPGSYTAFILVKKGDFAAFLPVNFAIQAPLTLPVTPIAPAALKPTYIDITPGFNAACTTLYQRQYLSPRPEGYSIGMRINGRYAWEWTHAGHNTLVCDDQSLRNAANGIYHTVQGWSFKTPPTGDNLACASIWDNFPTALTIPVNQSGKQLTVFLAGTTNAMQNGVENGRLSILYTDGSREELPLIHPDNFDDWLLPSLLSDDKIFYFSAFNHGQIHHFRLNPAKTVKELQVLAVANEVILSVMGVTLYR